MMRPIVPSLIVALLATCLWAEDKPAPKKKEDYQGKPTARMVHYTGNVQGVGFRATAVEIARNYPVTGWVKNLSDGRVQLLAEGPADAVADFLKAIRDKWPDNIKDAKVEERTVSGKYQKFTIEE